VKTAWTAAVLALAFIVGSVTADELRLQMRSRDDKPSLTDGSLHDYRVLNRAEAPRPDSRAWKGRPDAAPPPPAITPGRPLAYQDVSTPLELAAHGARLAHTGSARAPPPTA
jgi:hypothetical protein